MTKTKGKRIWLPGHIVDLLNAYIEKRQLNPEAAIAEAITLASYSTQSIGNPVPSPPVVLPSETIEPPAIEPPAIVSDPPLDETDDEFEIDLFA